MSHYSVAIITKGKPSIQKIDKILEPFDENKRVNIIVTKQEVINEAKEVLKHKEDIYARYLNGDKDIMSMYSELDIENILKNINSHKTDEDFYLDAIQDIDKEDILPDGGYINHYNPNSKWDWYQVGGRFLHRLKNNNPSFKIKSYDFLQVDEEKYEKALLEWMLRVENKKPENKEEEDFVNFSYPNKTYLKNRYKTKENYAKQCSTFATYAVITKDGKWHEPGKMCWFAVSSATPDEENEFYSNYYDNFIKNADDDDYITIVDCHI